MPRVAVPLALALCKHKPIMTQPTPILPTSIFNAEKTDYENTPIFLGQANGLFDSVNRQHPALWGLYKKLKKLDWDENDFSFLPCLTEFETCPKNIREAMISTIAWQWETDSVAANSVLAILSPFITSSEAKAYYSRVSDNEVVHALAYSEIVRNSFRDHRAIIDDILSRTRAFDRLRPVVEIFDETFKLSHQYALGLIPNDQALYNQVFKFVCALYILEAMEFMPSFAVTFAIAKSGWFMPIGSTVQKICQDEYEIHVAGGRYILDYEMRTDRGLTAFNANREWLIGFIDQVRRSEHKWSYETIPEGEEFLGMTGNLLASYEDYCATEVSNFFMLPIENPQRRNPIPWIEDWIDISRRQESPQENRSGQYFVGGIVDDLGERPIEINLG